MNKFSVRLPSASEKKLVLAEVWYQSDIWAEITKEEGRFKVVFLPPTKLEYWEFPVEDAVAILEEAKRILLEGTNE